MSRITPLAMFFVFHFVAPAISVADEAVQQVSSQLADHATVAVEKATGTFMHAIKGDKDALIELGTRYLLPAIVALLAITIGYMIASFVGRVVGTALAQRVDLTLGKFLGKTIKNATLVLVGLGVLGYFGVDVTSFAAILAATGFAIGMALQGTLSNFAAGVMLLVFRPFKVGDYIIVEGSQGSVEEIDLFTTKMNSLDNRHLIVPNSQIFGSTIENVTRNSCRRVEVNVGVDYSADLRMTRQVLSAVVRNLEGAIAAPAPDAYLMDLGDSAVNWQVRVWCHPSSYWEVRQRLTEATKAALDVAQIGIPFPQMDLHFKDLDQIVGGSQVKKAA